MFQLLWLIVVFVTTLAWTVHAAEPPPSLPEASIEEVCAELGTFAAAVTSMRDAGVTLETLVQAVEHIGRQVLPEVPVDGQDAVTARLLALVRELYADPGRTPEQAKQVAEQDCLKTPAPQ